MPTLEMKHYSNKIAIVINGKMANTPGKGNPFSKTKKSAFERICEGKEWKQKNYYSYETEISESEAFIIESLCKKGGFADIWREVEDMEYKELIDRLVTTFQAKRLSEC